GPHLVHLRTGNEDPGTRGLETVGNALGLELVDDRLHLRGLELRIQDRVRRGRHPAEEHERRQDQDDEGNGDPGLLGWWDRADHRAESLPELHQICILMISW